MGALRPEGFSLATLTSSLAAAPPRESNRDRIPYFSGPKKRRPPKGGLLFFGGGERGIRTLEGLLTLTPLAGERFRPLSHLSELRALKFFRTPN